MDGTMQFDFGEQPASAPTSDPADQAVTTHAGIVPRATVRAMVERRNKAVAMYERAFITLDAADRALKDALGAFKAIDPSETNAYIDATKEEERHFVSGLKVPTQADYASAARRIIDRRAWATLMAMTDLEKLMDKQAKDQLRSQLQADVPEVTEENVFATLEQFAADAGTIFKRGIANCFSKLDRRFKSHDGWKIGGRVILTHVFNDWGWSYSSHHRDTLHDIDRTFHVLDGGSTPETYGGIVAAIQRSRDGGHRPHQSITESEYFRVRGFKNGNAHVWFKRDDLVEKVNRLLGEYYGAPIPEEREAEEDSGLSTPKTSLAKNYGFFPTPDALADHVISETPLYREDGKPPLRILEPSAGTGQLASRAARHKGRPTVDCIDVQPAMCDRLNASGLYRSVRCADFLKLTPSGDYDLVLMNPPFDRERDIDHVMHALEFLKPGGCLVAIMSAGTEFRDTRKSTAFREHINKLGGRMQELPAGSFSSVGTNVNTILVRVYKDGHGQNYWGRKFQTDW